MITLLALATALAASSPVCTKLSADFEANEKSMAETDDLNGRINQNDYEIYKLLGGKRWLDNWQNSSNKISESNRTYEAKGNAITQLMIGHKCKLPDHITGSKNPNPQNQSQSAKAQSK